MAEPMLRVEALTKRFGGFTAVDQVSFTVEASGTAPAAGLWDCPLQMKVVYDFKDPDWQLVWEQPGNKVGKLGFGNVFWGEGDHLVLEWEAPEVHEGMHGPVHPAP